MHIKIKVSLGTSRTGWLLNKNKWIFACRILLASQTFDMQGERLAVLFRYQCGYTAAGSFSILRCQISPALQSLHR